MDSKSKVFVMETHCSSIHQSNGFGFITVMCGDGFFFNLVNKYNTHSIILKDVVRQQRDTVFRVSNLDFGDFDKILMMLIEHVTSHRLDISLLHVGKRYPCRKLNWDQQSINIT